MNPPAYTKILPCSRKAVRKPNGSALLFWDPRLANPSVAATSAQVRRPSRRRSPPEGLRGQLLIPGPAHSQLAGGQVAAAAQEPAWCGTLRRRETHTAPCAPPPRLESARGQTFLPRE